MIQWKLFAGDDDGDGIPDHLDDDDDNDGVPDAKDNDDDGDGIPDEDEGSSDEKVLCIGFFWHLCVQAVSFE